MKCREMTIIEDMLNSNETWGGVKGRLKSGWCIRLVSVLPIFSFFSFFFLLFRSGLVANGTSLMTGKTSM
jgi:hypothetical protein